MINTHKWSSTIINDIEQKLYTSFINKQSYSTKKTITKYIHRWLSSGSINSRKLMTCPHCHKIDNAEIDDHILTCSLSNYRKIRYYQSVYLVV